METDEPKQEREYHRKKRPNQEKPMRKFPVKDYGYRQSRQNE
ncbi:MAG: hypothetical protein ABJE00_10215 [Erythrobacter sp.]